MKGSCQRTCHEVKLCVRAMCFDAGSSVELFTIAIGTHLASGPNARAVTKGVASDCQTARWHHDSTCQQRGVDTLHGTVKASSLLSTFYVSVFLPLIRQWIR